MSNKRKSTIIVVGNVCLDMFLDEVTAWPGPGYRASQFRVPGDAIGGNGYNVAYGVAALDCDVTLVGAVGKDRLGERVRKDLKHYGIKLGIDPKDGTTGVSYVVMIGASSPNPPSKEPSYLHLAGVNSLLAPSDLRSTMRKGILKGAHVLHFCGIGMLPKLDGPEIAATIDLAKQKSSDLVVTLDVNLDAQGSKQTWKERLKHFLAKVDIIAPNVDEARQILGVRSSVADDELGEKLLRYDNLQAVAIKCGAAGSYVVHRDGNGGVKTVRDGARAVSRIVDLTGAGDAWCAGFLSVLASQVAEGTSLASVNWRPTIAKGNETAALCVATRGGSTWKP